MYDMSQLRETLSMELKKIIILLVVSSFVDTVLAQHFTVKPIYFENESIQIDEEIAEFSYETVSSVLALRNSSDKKILLSATIACCQIRSSFTFICLQSN